MPGVEVSLGRLDLECKDSGWQAQVHNAAAFSSSDGDLLAWLSQRLNESVLTDYDHELPWITRGHGFRLVLRLKFGSIPSVDEREMLIATLATQLRTAKLWTQLCLVPTSVELFAEDQGNHTISVFLKYDFGPSETVSRKLHKLDMNIPAQDIRPPPTVPVVALEIVRLEIQFVRCEQRKRRRLNAVMDKTSAAPPSQQHSIFPADNFILDVPAYLDYHEFQDTSLSKTIDVGAPATSSNWLMDGESFSLEVDETTLLLDSGTDYSSLDDKAANAIPSLVKRTSSFSDVECNPIASYKASVLDLVDAAIRISITRAPSRLPRGVLMTATQSLQHLSPLAPSLWSPGYLSTIASRAIFLPTICQSVNTIGAKSACVKSPQGEPILISDSALPRTMEAKASTHSFASTSALLWRSLCKRAFDRHAARQLAPISVATGNVPSDSMMEYEMLDFNRIDLPEFTIPVKMDEQKLSMIEDCNHGDAILDDELLSISDSLDDVFLLDRDFEDDFGEAHEFWDELELLDC